MMKRVFITFIFVFVGCLPLQAQKDTRGTDFWLTFARRELIRIRYPTTVIDTVNLQIRITAGNQATAGTIYFTRLNESVFFSVSPWSVFTHSLTFAQIQAVCYELPSTTAIDTSNHSVHITSDNPVSVYALNQKNAETDATNILPVTALGTDYYLFSYGNESNIDAYAVVATQNNTQVYHNGVLTATLNSGEVYYRTFFIPYAIADMTGEHITSDKPIALFNVNPNVWIPMIGYDTYPYGDNLFQQLAPIHTWGNNFFVPVSRRVRDAHCGFEKRHKYFTNRGSTNYYSIWRRRTNYA